MNSFLKAPPELRNGYIDHKRREAIRKMRCIACQIRKEEQQSLTEFHHFMGMGNGGKASDLLSIPLCNACHTGSYSKRIMGITIHFGLYQFAKRHGTQGDLLRIVDEALGVEYFGEIKIYLDNLLEMLNERELTDHSIINK
tara:strand:+ start:499 stop:921 length:423 start_codon:yes stop_codon:yes gene_type:complete